MQSRVGQVHPIPAILPASSVEEKVVEKRKSRFQEVQRIGRKFDYSNVFQHAAVAVTMIHNNDRVFVGQHYKKCKFPIRSKLFKMTRQSYIAKYKIISILVIFESTRRQLSN